MSAKKKTKAAKQPKSELTQTIAEFGDYRKSIAELLSHYEDGDKIFIKANEAGQWDYPVKIKEGSQDVNGLPRSWLELTERVLSIIATEKYGLDCYPNRIDIISSEQMLDAYAAVGMPVSYEHWSFGKQRVIEEKLYKQGKKGLAYEIVINTNPAIAYCMENNTPLMQMLVIAHASFGHNNFFKQNHMFKQHTEAQHIIGFLRDLRDYVRECEEKYGFERVEKVLDACHALQTHAVNRYKRSEKRSQDELIAKAKRRMEDRFRKPEESDIYSKIRPKDEFKANADKQKGPKKHIDVGMEENILQYMADNAPHLEDWQREIMRRIAYKSQYFYPQRQTQVMNEGWASFWHYTLLHDMRDLDLIDDKMIGEFQESHAGVLYQPVFRKPQVIWTQNGPQQIPMQLPGFNPYTLGFEIFMDLKRMCENPTEEDYEHFPHIAGNDDWLGVLKDAMENFKDESFVLQFLSPKLIRDFQMFTMSDSGADYLEVTSVQNRAGYDKIREALASNYRLAEIDPALEVAEYHYKSDRELVLEHTVFRGRPLDKKDTMAVMRHMYQIWQHPITIRSVTPEGKVLDEMSMPPKPKTPRPDSRQESFDF